MFSNIKQPTPYFHNSDSQMIDLLFNLHPPRFLIAITNTMFFDNSDSLMKGTGFNPQPPHRQPPEFHPAAPPPHPSSL